METERIPSPGQIYRHFKNKLYQIITLAEDAENGTKVVVYQALYGEFKTYFRTMESFLSEVDRDKYPDIAQKYRFERYIPKEAQEDRITEQIHTDPVSMAKTPSLQESIAKQENIERIVQDNKETVPELVGIVSEEKISTILMQFLDAESYYKKMEILTANRKHINDRMVNDMAVSIDCTVDEGSLEDRIQGLIRCLQAMCRFENKRLR